MTKTEQQKMTELQECANRADKLLNDIFPQIGKLCIQDFANLNELALLLTKHAKPID